MFYEDFDFETKLASELKNQNKFLMNVVTELRDVTETKLSLYKYFEQNFVLSNTKINNAKLWQTKKLFAMKVSRIFEEISCFKIAPFTAIAITSSLFYVYIITLFPIRIKR